jgi:hypothetical protein
VPEHWAIVFKKKDLIARVEETRMQFYTPDGKKSIKKRKRIVQKLTFYE